MRPICFFPFTYMDPEQTKTVTTFFSQTRILDLGSEGSAAMVPHMDQKEILPVAPPEETLQMAELRTREYLEWAKLHRGNERNLKALMRETAYFRDDTGPSSIQSQIRRGMTGGAEKTDTREQDPLLFLKLAEIWDRDNDVIRQELKALDAGNAALFAELKGELPQEEAGGDLTNPADDGRDSGETMTGERISAWCEMAEKTGLMTETNGAPLLVTTSPAVMEYLETSADEVINGLDIESIKVHESGCACKERWQQDLIEILEHPLSSNAPTGNKPAESFDCCSLSGQIKLSILSGERLEQTVKFPGERLAACLVKLNS